MDKTRALYRAVHGFTLGTRSLAAAMVPCMGKSTLLHKACPTDRSQFFSPEEAIQVQQITGDHGGLQVEAQQLGYILLKRPPMDVEGTRSYEQVSLTVQQFSEYLTATTGALADGRITQRERDQVEAECAGAITAIQDLVGMIQAMHEACKPASERGEA